MTNFKDLVINSDEKLCYLKGNPIKSEYNILSFILNNRNKIFSREELINNAWKEPVTNRAVDTAISRLRKKIGEYSTNIVSRIGFGYGFMENI